MSEKFKCQDCGADLPHTNAKSTLTGEPLCMRCLRKLCRITWTKKA
jgi:hypothetical protein